MKRAFADRTVVITGASAGIGLSCARQFAEAGARVVLVARGAAELERARAEVAAIGPAHAIAADVAAPDGPERIVSGALEVFGALHVLVNNAGRHARGPFGDLAEADLAAMVDVNLRAPIVLTRRALPHLIASGHGAVVNVASLAGKVPVPGSVAYSATKFGLRGFSMALADELRGTGVTVSCVSPGPVETQFIMAELDTVTDLTMSQPMVTADQVAALVVRCALDGKLERATPPAVERADHGGLPRARAAPRAAADARAARPAQQAEAARSPRRLMVDLEGLSHAPLWGLSRPSREIHPSARRVARVISSYPRGRRT